MASSKTKSTKSSKKVNRKSKVKLEAPDAWINELAGLQINDENWKCFVAIIEENSTDASVFIDHYNEVAMNGNRMAMRSISKLNVIKCVVENMEENNPGKEITPLTVLCSEIYKLVGPTFTAKIPPSLLAPLIKYLLLKYKTSNIKVRQGIEEKLKDLDAYQQSLWNMSKAKAASTKGAKSEVKSDKADKKSPKKTKEKPFTKLRKRGEEWKDIVWVDDAPVDGPLLYVTISSFFDADLPLELINIDVPLNAIIKLQLLKDATSENRSSMPMELKEIIYSLHEFNRMSTPFLSSNVGKRFENHEASLRSKNVQIYMFWKSISELKEVLPTALMFKNIMFLDFIPQHSDFEFQIDAFQSEIYRQISHFLYDAFEITKQHKAYLCEMKEIDVLDSVVCDLSTMTVYNTVLDSVPHEVLTIPFILDTIVTQVCSLQVDKPVESVDSAETTQSRFDTEPNINVEFTPILQLLQDLNITYDLFHDPNLTSVDTNSSEIVAVLNNATGIKRILTYSDFIDIKTYHLEESAASFVRNRTNYILYVAWEYLLMKFIEFSTCDRNLIKLCNEIIAVKEKRNQEELYYFVYLLIINSVLNLLEQSTKQSPDKQNCLRDEIDTNDMCEDCIVEITQDKTWLVPHSDTSSISSVRYSLTNEIIAGNFFYIEDMNSDILLQTLQESFQKFSRIKVKHCPFTEQMILVFHNLQCNRDWVFEEQWMGKLTTRVPLRDFVDYILDEEDCWLNRIKLSSNCEISDIYDKTSRSTTEKEIRLKQTFLFPDSQFISLRSLKHEILMKQKIMAKKSPSIQEKSQTIKSSPSAMKKADLDIKSKDKSKQKSAKSESMHEDTLQDESKDQHFTFLGYSLGEPMRFQFNGFHKDKLLNHNCRLMLKTYKKLYGEETCTAIVTVNGHELFYNYKSYSKSVSYAPFHLILSSGIVLYFEQPEEKNTPSSIFQNISFLPEIPTNNNFDTINDSKSQVKDFFQLKVKFKPSYESMKTEETLPILFPVNIYEPNYCRIPSTYNLRMSTPSGLHIKLMQSKDLLYTHQKLLSKGIWNANIQLERNRCYLSCGYIIKFLMGDEIQVLGPSGEIYNIYKIKDISPDNTSGNELNAKENTGKLDFETTANNLIHTKDIVEDSTDLPKNKINVKKRKLSSEKKQHFSRTSSVLENLAFIVNEESDIKSSLENCHYKLTTLNGTVYEIKDGEKHELTNLLMISSIDIGNNCINSERLDGLKTKHLADGSLIVQFLDGSCITSTPVKTNDELFCEWSSDEFALWFERNLSQTSSIVSNREGSTTTLILNEESSCEYYCPYCNLDNKKLNYSEDGFVVYNLSYLLEHPNYGTVYYDAKNSEVHLRLPFSTITLRQDGSFEGNFDGANLIVKKDEISFNREDDQGNILRTVLINTCGPSVNQFFDTSNKSYDLSQENAHASLFSSNNTLVKLDTYNEFDLNFLYSVDEFGNELFINYCADILEKPILKMWRDMEGYDFSCFVVNNDLSGLRLVSDCEVEEHIVSVSEKGGLVTKTDTNKWINTFTSLAMKTNESAKWLMSYQEDAKKSSKEKNRVSTYGERGSWFQPFVEINKTEEEIFTTSEVVIVRLLHRIPTEKSILDGLKVALEGFKRGTKNTRPMKTTHNAKKGDINLAEIVAIPRLLEEIYVKERSKISKEQDKFRTGMLKHDYLRLLVHQACIKARKLRQSQKIEEFKAVLRYKAIPPYHLSCFGQVHDVLDKLLENVRILKKPSTPSIYSKVNNDIDELLCSDCRMRSVTEESICEECKPGIGSLVSEIFCDFCALAEARNQQNLINTILDKRLDLVTSDDVEFLCQTLKTEPVNCQILYKEEFILQDVLEARYQLSHYFATLREMLEAYRGRCQKQTLNQT